MAVPALNLNLAPHPSLWRRQHKALGWASLVVGGLGLLATLGFTWNAYYQARREGREAVSLTEEAKRVARREKDLQATLQDIDATKEQARWKLAERILQERSLPWSRLTAELERCMVPDMRLRSIQRVRGTGSQVVMKLKGEARTVAAETAFIAALHGSPVFDQVVLEREAERQGGGWDFELTLPVVAVPPPFRQDPQEDKGKASAPAQPAFSTRTKPEAPTAAPPTPRAQVSAAPAPPPPKVRESPEPVRVRSVPSNRRPSHRTRPDPADDRSPE